MLVFCIFFLKNLRTGFLIDCVFSKTKHGVHGIVLDRESKSRTCEKRRFPRYSKLPGLSEPLLGEGSSFRGEEERLFV